MIPATPPAPLIHHPPTCLLTKFVRERKSLFALTKICPFQTEHQKAVITQILEHFEDKIRFIDVFYSVINIFTLLLE
jgi:hypothetical protein